MKIANIVPYSSCCVSGNIKGGRAWIGGTDERSQGVWEWTDGSPWGYENWRKPSEPNNLFGNEDCTIIWGRTGKWFDVRCDGFFKAGYVCSYNLNGKKFTQGYISIISHSGAILGGRGHFFSGGDFDLKTGFYGLLPLYMNYKQLPEVSVDIKTIFV